MRGCLGSLRADIKVAVGDTTKDTQYVFSRSDAFTHQKRTSRVDIFDRKHV